MTNSEDKFKPIKIFGYVVSTFGIVCLAMAASIPPPPWAFQHSLFIAMVIFGGIEMVLWVLGGIGIATRKMWGFYLLKIILYALIISFPIGTIIAVKMLKYIRENNIKDYFGRKYIAI